jgi:integrase
MGRKSRVYWRNQGGVRRAYGDFRDLGGKLEALIAKGETRATSDFDVANQLVSLRVAELERRKRQKGIRHLEGEATLIAYSLVHLEAKKTSGSITEQWQKVTKHHLATAIEYFCNRGAELVRDDQNNPIFDDVPDRDLESISVAEVQKYIAWLAKRSNGRGGTLSPSAQRKHLNSLSNLYRRAASEECVPPGYNPVQALIEKPRDGVGRSESNWLEVPDAALLLESARLFKAKRGDVAFPDGLLHALIATMLLTGGRPAEVLGLEVADISFKRETVTFREHDHRRLKNRGSSRVVPLWPQLREILSAYLKNGPKEGLLFPSPKTGGLITDVRKALDQVAVAAGWKVGEVRPYAFRHTYCAARLQTLDQGAPIAPFTVARELGHGGDALVKRTYGHPGTMRHRVEVVEYRVEQHKKDLGGRLVALRERTARLAAA